MQRIQGQGHAPAAITSPSTSSPSAQPNSPFKARRASGHPPLSHQTQIMKAVRRSSALPSLSISIPPSPTEDPVVGTDGLHGELASKKEERTKTVTFSDPEEEDDGESSDQSSICQSPSWEQFGRKKQKKPKKLDAEQDNKSKEKFANTNTLMKKKGNKLSKVPPNVRGVEPLATADRSQSAPELDIYLKSNTANLETPNPTPSVTMANQKLESKPKSKGFLSSFRLQHGNVAAVQKIVEGQRVSTDGSQHSASPMLKPHPAVSGVEPSFTNPRNPPSIRSAVSNSTRSISSLDQLPTARNSSSPSHGRSQSLLSSTWSKLKGPSYLYYRPTGNAHNVEFQRPSSSQEPDVTSRWSSDQSIRQPIEKQPERPRERPVVTNESTKQLPEFKFPQKQRQFAPQPMSDIAARGVRDQTQYMESKELSNGYEPQEPSSFRSRRTQMPPMRAPSREPATEREMRARSERAPRAPRQPVENPRSDDIRPTQARQPSRVNERQNHASRPTHAYVQPRVESWDGSQYSPEPPPSSQRDVSNFENDQRSQPEVSHDRDEEDDRVSVGTHASTIRPLSRRQGHSSPETNGRKHVTFPPSPTTIGRAVTSHVVDEEEEVHAETMEPEQLEQPGHLIEIEETRSTEKPMRLERSADYFSFINQSYAPPSLELRSPMEGKFPSLRIDEEPEEDDDLDHILRHIPVRSHFHEMPSPPEGAIQPPAFNMQSPSRFVKHNPSKNSPSISSHYSDSDVPAFERLGLSPKAARILVGAETSSTSTSQSNTDPSQSTSERSSSSTCDDAPPTPDSSRPQSRKGQSSPQVYSTNSSSVNDDETTPRKSYRPSMAEPPAKHRPRSTGKDVDFQDDSWSRTAFPIDLDSHPTEAPTKRNGQTPSPTTATFVEEVDEIINRNPYLQPIPVRAQSALELHSTDLLPDLKHQPLYSRKAKGGISSISLPNSPPPELVDAAPRKSAMRASRKYNSNSDSALVSPGAAYLQEARKAAPIPPTATSRALRPHYAHKNSSTSVKSEGRSEPLAKMLVECCNCKFFHDMPSRVYECMAKPDSLVEDKLLGVSATITTMVKCPWCAHGMTTQCCSGYAAVVYLKEKLHGSSNRI